MIQSHRKRLRNDGLERPRLASVPESIPIPFSIPFPNCDGTYSQRLTTIADETSALQNLLRSL